MLLLGKDPVVAMLSFSTLGSVKKGGKLDCVREAIEIIKASEGASPTKNEPLSLPPATTRARCVCLVRRRRAGECRCPSSQRVTERNKH